MKSYVSSHPSSQTKYSSKVWGNNQSESIEIARCLLHSNGRRETAHPPIRPSAHPPIRPPIRPSAHLPAPVGHEHRHIDHRPRIVLGRKPVHTVWGSQGPSLGCTEKSRAQHSGNRAYGGCPHFGGRPCFWITGQKVAGIGKANEGIHN